MDLESLAELLQSHSISIEISPGKFGNSPGIRLPISYEKNFLDYQREYHGVYSTDFGKNISSSHINSTGFWPVVVSNGILSSDGKYLYPPIFSNDCTQKQKNRILRKIFSGLVEISNSRELKNIGQVKINSMDSVDLHPWVELALDLGKILELRQEVILELGEPLESIYANFGSTTKRNIKIGLDTFDLIIVDDNEVREYWSIFKTLHLEVAGRVTRNDKTWEIQEKNIISGGGFLVIAKERQSQDVISGIYVEHNKLEAIYAVAATKREFFEVGVNHAMQWLVIQNLVAKGVKRYILGEKPYEGQSLEIDKKQIDIGIFKRQFSQKVSPTYLISI